MRKQAVNVSRRRDKTTKHPIVVRFGRGIAILRSRRSLTRKGLANRLKVSYVQLGFWERGVCGPPIPKLFALTRILETSLDELIEVGGSTGSQQPERPEKKGV